MYSSLGGASITSSGSSSAIQSSVSRTITTDSPSDNSEADESTSDSTSFMVDNPSTKASNAEKNADSKTFSIDGSSIIKRNGELKTGESSQYIVTFAQPSKVRVTVSEGGPVKVYAKKGADIPSKDTFTEDYTKRYLVKTDDPATFKVEEGKWVFTLYTDQEPGSYEFAGKKLNS